MTRILLLSVALLLVACAGPSTAAPEVPLQTPELTLRIASERSVFDVDRLSVPADTAFALHYQNHDRVPHNVSIRGAAQPLVGEIFSGPGERTYYFPALPAGTYRFVCDVHPEMAGTVEVYEQ